MPFSVLTFCSRSGAPTIPPDRVPRVQRGVGVLEDHLDVTAQRPHLPGPQVRDVVAVEHDAARGRLEQPGEQPPGRGLAAAGLADHAQRLAGGDGEADVVDRLHRADLLPPDDAPGDREMLGQPGDLEEGAARVVHGAERAGRAHRGAHASPWGAAGARPPAGYAPAAASAADRRSGDRPPGDPGQPGAARALRSGCARRSGRRNGTGDGTGSLTAPGSGSAGCPGSGEAAPGGPRPAGAWRPAAPRCRDGRAGRRCPRRCRTRPSGPRT